MEQENPPQPAKTSRKYVHENFVGTIIASVVVIALLAVAGYYFLNERLTEQKNTQAAEALEAAQLAQYASTTTVIIQATTTTPLSHQ